MDLIVDVRPTCIYTQQFGIADRRSVIIMVVMHKKTVVRIIPNSELEKFHCIWVGKNSLLIYHHQQQQKGGHFWAITLLKRFRQVTLGFHYFRLRNNLFIQRQFVTLASNRNRRTRLLQFCPPAKCRSSFAARCFVWKRRCSIRITIADVHNMNYYERNTNKCINISVGELRYLEWHDFELHFCRNLTCFRLLCGTPKKCSLSVRCVQRKWRPLT